MICCIIFVSSIWNPRRLKAVLKTCKNDKLKTYYKLYLKVSLDIQMHLKELCCFAQPHQPFPFFFSFFFYSGVYCQQASQKLMLENETKNLNQYAGRAKGNERKQSEGKRTKIDISESVAQKKLDLRRNKYKIKRNIPTP